MTFLGTEQHNYKIPVVGAIKEENAEVTIFFKTLDRFYIKLKSNEIELCAEGSDYFDAFCSIRIQLEKYNLIPFCYASSLNHFPSGMSRTMGHGLKSYKLELNKSCTEEPVDIFGHGRDITPSTVNEQEHFHKK
jgi:hypothetical protein